MNNSHEWLKIIMKRLFEAESRRIDMMVQKLTERNSAIKKTYTLGFMHLGEVYIPECNKEMYRMTAANVKSSQTPALAFELLSDIGSFISDVKKLELDKAQIKQVFFKLLINCNYKQEVRDSLPDCVITFMPELKELNRQMEDPCYLIRSDWRAVRDYERMLPKIEMYAMTRMIY